MKIGIIGAGFTGLSAAYRLAKKGHDITVIESGSAPGGLAIGFIQKEWKWTLEEHYHHWFTNDYSVLNLAKEIGYPVKTVRPKTSTYIDGKIYQLDSPISLLKFNKLSLLNRLRTGVVLAYLKITPFWKVFEKQTAEKFLLDWMGDPSWNTLWKPLFTKKFGKFYKEVSAAWFWARIKKRTPSLAYPEKGFLNFANVLVKKIEKKGVKFFFNQKANNISRASGQILVKTDTEKFSFDRVICTLPNHIFFGITKNPKPIRTKKLNGLGAVNLVVVLDKSYFIDGSYWMNINDENFPFLAVIEHTNFISKKNYSGQKIIYIGNYLESGHPYFEKTAKELLQIFTPYLKKINPNFSKKNVLKSFVFKAPFAQPVIPRNYSKRILSHQTNIKDVFLANIQQVYPWDRGTNYAVELGEKVANIVLKSIDGNNKS